jgi:hypothetical protein
MTLDLLRPDGAAAAEEILASHFRLASVAGVIERSETRGVEGWRASLEHPALSLFRWTTPDDAEARAALDEVCAWFDARGRRFDWMTGPDCAERGREALLRAKGFEPMADIAAMAADIDSDHAQAAKHAAGVRVRRVADGGDPRAWRVMAAGFGIPDSVAAAFHHAYLAPSAFQRTEVHIAELDGDPAPVGVGYLSYIADGSAVLLRVSCTLEASRGRGVYSALIASRLAAALRAGRRKAYVHAYNRGL